MPWATQLAVGTALTFGNMEGSLITLLVLHVIYVFILITVNLVALCGSIKKSMWYDKIK